MDNRRMILYVIFGFMLYWLWMNWTLEHPTAITTTILPSEPAAATSIATTDIDNTDPFVSPKVSARNAARINKRLIHVQTDVLSLDIDAQYGDVVNTALLKYPESIDAPDKPFILLTNDNFNRYVAHSNLLEGTKTELQNMELIYKTAQPTYQFDHVNDKQLKVILDSEIVSGLHVRKTLEFTRGSYLIKINYEINNNGASIWRGYLNTQFLRTSPKEDESNVFHVGSYTGAAYSNPLGPHYQKISFDKMRKSGLNTKVTGGWIAMQQHYFLSAWVPNNHDKNIFYTKTAQDNYTIGFLSQPLILNPQATKNLQSVLYLAQEIASSLKKVAPNLDLTVDYGWLWFLSSFIFIFLKGIYGVVGNWGWAIVIVTLLIKLGFYHLSAASYRSMACMRSLQPKLQGLRERYGDDKIKLSQATMEMYRQEKINPLGGCLPIVVKIPVFIALYWVLLESVELRQAPFILWINDLAAADPWHILPIIMGGTMLIQQRLNPAPPDPMQAKIMLFLPILFTGLFWNFPSGLVLYWIMNNTLSILQQWYITRKYSTIKHVKYLKR